jgi:hypothetical protein
MLQQRLPPCRGDVGFCLRGGTAMSLFQRSSISLNARSYLVQGVALVLVPGEASDLVQCRAILRSPQQESLEELLRLV